MFNPLLTLSGVFRQPETSMTSSASAVCFVSAGRPVHAGDAPPGVIVYVGVFTSAVLLSECDSRIVTLLIVASAGMRPWPVGGLNPLTVIAALPLEKVAFAVCPSMFMPFAPGENTLTLAVPVGFHVPCTSWPSV